MQKSNAISDWYCENKFHIIGFFFLFYCRSFLYRCPILSCEYGAATWGKIILYVPEINNDRLQGM